MPKIRSRLTRSTRYLQVNSQKGLSFSIKFAKQGPITCMKWDSDGNFLVSGSADRTVKIWTTYGGASRPLQNYENHKGGINVVQWGPPGAKGNRLLASCSDDGTALLWDVEYGKVLHVLDGKKMRAFTAMSFSPNGKLIATGDQDGVVQIWSTKVSHLCGVEVIEV